MRVYLIAIVGVVLLAGCSAAAQAPPSPPTATSIPATATSIPPTSTPRPTNTPRPATATPTPKPQPTATTAPAPAAAKPVAKPAAKPNADFSCPADFPIKGNIGVREKIYHRPGGASYRQTEAEACFDTATSAEAAGYRAAQR